MKKLLVCSLLMLAAYNTASANERCGMPEGSACRNFYSKFDAFKRLQENENDINDAQGNLALVESVQKRYNLNLEYTVDNFIYLQTTVGGSSETAAARDTFSLIAQEINDRNSLHNLTDRMVDLVKTENDNNDARGNFSLIAEKSRYGRSSINQATQLFLAVLKIEGGSSSTAGARDAFSRLIAQENKYSLPELAKNYRALFESENDRNDAVGNLEIVLLAAKECGDLTRATQDFIDVLNQVGGSSATAKARELYRSLYSI